MLYTVKLIPVYIGVILTSPCNNTPASCCFLWNYLSPTHSNNWLWLPDDSLTRLFYIGISLFLLRLILFPYPPDFARYVYRVVDKVFMFLLHYLVFLILIYSKFLNNIPIYWITILIYTNTLISVIVSNLFNTIYQLMTFFH